MDWASDSWWAWTQRTAEEGVPDLQSPLVHLQSLKAEPEKCC